MTTGGAGQGGVPAANLPVRITSLQMLTRPARTPAPRPADIRVERVIKPSVAFYRFLYNTVGEDWLWFARRRWTDQEIAATVQDPAVDLWLMSVDGQPAGYAELDRRVAELVELAYFGLMPDFIGRGLGQRLLRFAVDKAWDANPTRLWLHTCTFDHPAALRTYQRAGFTIFKTEDLLVEDPRITGLIPAAAAAHVPLQRSSII